MLTGNDSTYFFRLSSCNQGGVSEYVRVRVSLEHPERNADSKDDEENITVGEFRTSGFRKFGTSGFRKFGSSEVRKFGISGLRRTFRYSRDDCKVVGKVE